MKVAYTGWMWLRAWAEDTQQFPIRFEQCVKEKSEAKRS